MTRIFVVLFSLIAGLTPATLAAQETQTFSRPKVDGVRLDWCKHRGGECGAPAARFFCERNGYSDVSQFLIDPGIGARGIPTVIFGDGRICRSPRCSGFIAITCTTGSNRSQNRSAAAAVPQPSAVDRETAGSAVDFGAVSAPVPKSAPNRDVEIAALSTQEQPTSERIEPAPDPQPEQTEQREDVRPTAEGTEADSGVTPAPEQPSEPVENVEASAPEPERQTDRNEAAAPAAEQPAADRAAAPAPEQPSEQAEDVAAAAAEPEKQPEQIAAAEPAEPEPEQQPEAAVVAEPLPESQPDQADRVVALAPGRPLEQEQTNTVMVPAVPAPSPRPETSETNAAAVTAPKRAEMKTAVAPAAEPPPQQPENASVAAPAPEQQPETSTEVALAPSQTLEQLRTNEISIPAPKPRPDRPEANRIAALSPQGLQGFEPLPAAALAAQWVDLLNTLGSYPEGANLAKCATGDCTMASPDDFQLDGQRSAENITLAYRVETVPHAAGALWQVSYLPFPPFGVSMVADTQPPGLITSGLLEHKQGRFAFNPKELVDGLPEGAEQAIFHVRVLPVASGSNRIVGQPSNTIRAYHRAAPPQEPPYEIYAKQEVPDSGPDIRLSEIVFEPLRRVERWPDGCMSWEEKYGEAEKSDAEQGERLAAAGWNWTGKQYQWMKNRVVAVAAGQTSDAIPPSTLEYALNAALTAAGIPPDIPNLDEMIREGVDGLSSELARTVAQQMPAEDLASSIRRLANEITAEGAAELSEDALRDRLRSEIKQSSRAALTQAADELTAERRAEDAETLCQPAHFHGVYKVTVQNTGDEDYSDLLIRANAAPVYLDRTWSIDLAPGEKMTLVAVATPRLPNGPYSHPLLPLAKRQQEDIDRWWNDIAFEEDVSIEVTLPGVLNCLGGDASSGFCEQTYISAHRSPAQPATEQYTYSR